MIGKAAGALAAAGAVYALGVALAKRQNRWEIAYGRNGYHLEVTDAPTWAILLEDALGVLPCLCNAPGWAYKVGLRRLGTYDDETGDPIHSLGSLGYEVCNLRASIVWSTENNASHIPLTRDQALELAPDWVAQCDDIFDDEDEESKPCDLSSDSTQVL